MSKRKPDQVVEFRLSLQDKEREMFDSLVGAYQIDKVSEAVDQALSFQNVYLGITLIEIATGKEILFGTPNDIQELIGDVRGLFERAPLTAAQEAAIQETASLYQQQAGVDPATGQAYTSVAQLWATAFGVNLP